MADLPKIVALEKQSFDDPYPQSLFRTFLQRFPQGVRVAIVEGELAGYCAILPLRNKGEFVLTSIAVLPKFKKKRIGSALLADAISIARQNEASKLSLQVATYNESALNMYSKFGFKEEGILKDYYGNGRDGIAMVYVMSHS